MQRQVNSLGIQLSSSSLFPFLCSMMRTCFPRSTLLTPLYDEMRILVKSRSFISWVNLALKVSNLTFVFESVFVVSEFSYYGLFYYLCWSFWGLRLPIRERYKTEEVSTCSEVLYSAKVEKCSFGLSAQSYIWQHTTIYGIIKLCIFLTKKLLPSVYSKRLACLWWRGLRYRGRM